jgi:tetratricopeptide (TPR) repeat protein
VTGRALAWGLSAALGLFLLGQTVRWRDRMLAGRLLRQVEGVSLAVVAGQAPKGLLGGNLQLLRRAAALDPVEVGIPIARGSQHLLLGSPDAAIEAYREAMALEPRPEIYLNLGRAEQAAGRPEEAQRDFKTAVQLDAKLAQYVPEEMR